jgi:hypothetical protein
MLPFWLLTIFQKCRRKIDFPLLARMCRDTEEGVQLTMRIVPAVFLVFAALFAVLLAERSLRAQDTESTHDFF